MLSGSVMNCIIVLHLECKVFAMSANEVVNNLYFKWFTDHDVVVVKSWESGGYKVFNMLYLNLGLKVIFSWWIRTLFTKRNASYEIWRSEDTKSQLTGSVYLLKVQYLVCLLQSNWYLSYENTRTFPVCKTKYGAGAVGNTCVIHHWA